MKNHYISQLILKRFSNVLYIFDHTLKKVTRHTRTENIFYKNNIFSEDIETLMNEKLEGPFAKLLDQKILGKSTISLTRQDLLLIKRYLLLDSVKTYDPDEFLKVILNFKKNSDRYLKLLSTLDETEYTLLKNMPSIDDITDSPFNLQMRAMKLFIDCEHTKEMLFSPLCIKEFYTWAKVILDAFLTFCESHDTQEFILTDNGMTSEYEPSHWVFEGLDISKEAYLKYKLHTTRDIKKLYRYASLLASNQIMYETFNIFNLSSTQCIVLANPFFRLFDGKGYRVFDTNEQVDLDIPDIWPSFFETRDIARTPENKYKVPGLYSVEDEFIYHPCKLSLFDTIHVNILILSQAKNLIAFNDYKKVADSLGVMTFYKLVNTKEIYDDDCTFSTCIDILANDDYNYIFKYFKELKFQGSLNPLIWLDHFANMAMRDIKCNKYLLQYLLDMEDEVRTMSNFKFMGSPDNRIELIKSDLRKLTE